MFIRQIIDIVGNSKNTNTNTSTNTNNSNKNRPKPRLLLPNKTKRDTVKIYK